MTVPDDPVLVVTADADAASLARVLAEIAAMQRSSAITNEDFAAAIRICQDVLDDSLIAAQLQKQGPRQPQPPQIVAQAQPQDT